ncbi:MAG: hypothetical protein R3F43_27035 [bacterium]
MICPACHYPEPGSVCVACGARSDGPGASPPVGRARALAVLDARLDEVLRMDRPHVVGVVGGAGSGRSTLMNAFARRRANAFSRVHTLRGFADATGPDAWCPLGRLVHVACGLDARWAPGRRRAEARDRLAALLPDAPDRLLRALEAMLAPPGPGAVLDPVVIQEAFGRFLEAHLARAPLLILLESCAGASERVLGVLDALRGRAAGAVLVLCELDPAAAAERFTDRLDEVVPLDPLDADDIAERLGVLAERAPAPEAIAEAVLAATGGHVASVWEAGRTLLAAGAAPRGLADWILPAPLPPLTAGQASARRIASLPDPARRVLEAAALVGPIFHAADIPVVDEAADGAPGRWPALAAGLQAGLVSPLGMACAGGSRPPPIGPPSWRSWPRRRKSWASCWRPRRPCAARGTGWRPSWRATWSARATASRPASTGSRRGCFTGRAARRGRGRRSSAPCRPSRWPRPRPAPGSWRPR